MAKATDLYECIEQNITDAGYDEEAAHTLTNQARQGKWIRLLSVFKARRSTLLGELHDCENRLDCLDFLIHRITKLMKEDES